MIKIITVQLILFFIENVHNCKHFENKTSEILDNLWFDLKRQDQLIKKNSDILTSNKHISLLHISLLHISLLHISLLHISLLHISLLHISLLHISLLHISLLHISLLHISFNYSGKKFYYLETKFSTLHFLRNLWMGPISKSVRLHLAGKACQGQTL